MLKFSKLLNNIPHTYRRTSSLFHSKILKSIYKDSHSFNSNKPYKILLGKNNTPSYNIMKHNYSYTIVDSSECFENLYKIKHTNRSKEITFRLLYNITPLSPHQNCLFCTPATKMNEVHLFTKCSRYTNIRKDLERSITRFNTSPTDIHKAILTNTVNTSNDSALTITLHLIHEYRRCIWYLHYTHIYDVTHTDPLSYWLVHSQQIITAHT